MNTALKVLLLSVGVAVLAGTEARAQSARENNARGGAPSAVYPKGADKKPSRREKKMRVGYANGRNPFVEARLREREKQAQEMQKPQYADKSYFGHKRPPKKRPVHKRKLCNECGIVH